MAKFDPEREVHKAWLGLVQPVGLVVSPLALIKAQVFPDRAVAALQDAWRAITATAPDDAADARLTDLPRLFLDVLGWDPADLAGGPGGPPIPPELSVPLPEYGETLRPDFVAVDGMAGDRPLLLIVAAPRGAGLDEPTDHPHGWGASPQARLERLLRDTGVPAGLLSNGDELRLVYAPRGESSGHLGFPVAEMATVAGRPLLAALHMLLSAHRVFGAPDKQRLLDLLADSRKYQSEVSNRLAEQVLGALWELLRGFQAADEAANGRVLYDLPRTDPSQIYGGLLTVIMRLVFLLYAEDQGLMPDDPVYVRNYAIGGLFERLREDEGRHPDTMDQRFGAWAGLLATFRMVFDGGGHGATLRLPTRHGQLFNPDEYPFLEGRAPGVRRVMGEAFDAPRVSDGVIWRVLRGLLVLGGERLSYRALDVEQVGSVYESMMGFDVRTFPGQALAVRPKNVVFDVDALLRQPAGKRAAWLKEHAECDLAAGAGKQLAEAQTAADVAAALGRKLAPQTPQPLPKGALFLQPGEERRRSGSHYTPRELTEPIVRTTLRPVLDALGPKPTPEQILGLKVCDPAMGSGAFLVEACRQLAAALVAAWEAHGSTPKLPPDEDPLLHARRLVAQRCLYGVDKNPFAVNLAKLSLWLVTLARDHAFTFLDHALKHGDSLVGLSKAQIGAFHWDPPVRDYGPLFQGITTSVDEARRMRGAIHGAGESTYDDLRARWRDAEDAIAGTRLVGDLCVAAFFAADKDKDREAKRLAYRQLVDEWRRGGDRGPVDAIVQELRGGERPVPALHWEVEFPEVFGRENPGFDAMVGNPPFLGGKRISTNYGDGYRDWLAAVHEGSNSNADLVAHFYRRAFAHLRPGGTSGLIATNTIGQGDTRATGLRWICTHGGEIYAATRRVKWPGLAAVVVSVVSVARGPWTGTRRLDGRDVEFISAYLFHAGGHDDPHQLAANAGKSFVGSYVLGMGFTFDDTDKSGAASPIAEMHRLIEKDPRNAERIFPYIGGEEVNSSPTHAHHRYVINFGEMTEEEARTWPDLMTILEVKVKPDRQARDASKYPRMVFEWWKFWNARPELTRVSTGMTKLLVIARVSNAFAFTWLDGSTVCNEKIIVLPFSSHASFGVLQSRSHEVWGRFFNSSLKDDMQYTPSDCFETFPFPPSWQSDPSLEAAGQAYYDFRAALMVRNHEGLTKTYNRFHDPSERDPEIVELRALHAAMDRAVLDAYGWSDIPTDCDFFLDYEIDEETWGDKKKPWRYRWPDAVRDEVLARLLDLNQKRYAEEVAAGLHGGAEKAKAAKAPKGAAEKPKAPRKAKGAAEAPRSPTYAAKPLGLFGEDGE